MEGSIHDFFEQHVEAEIEHYPSIHENLYVLREDKLHHQFGGNKWRKLKYWLIEAEAKGVKHLASIGGAYSNHLFALSYACKQFGFEFTAFVRGEEHLPLNPTLSAIKQSRHDIRYVSRSLFRQRDEPEIVRNWLKESGATFFIPEGGGGALGEKGCREILGRHTAIFDIVAVAAGTGTTAKGLLSSIDPQQELWVFPVLKQAEYLAEEISYKGEDEKVRFFFDAHFGGYAKVDQQMTQLLRQWNDQHNLQLDPIYTGKLLRRLLPELEHQPNKKVLMIHTGGLQGLSVDSG